MTYNSQKFAKLDPQTLNAMQFDNVKNILPDTVQTGARSWYKTASFKLILQTSCLAQHIFEGPCNKV